MKENGLLIVNIYVLLSIYIVLLTNKHIIIIIISFLKKFFFSFLSLAIYLDSILSWRYQLKEREGKEVNPKNKEIEIIFILFFLFCIIWKEIQKKGCGESVAWGGLCLKFHPKCSKFGKTVHRGSKT